MQQHTKQKWNLFGIFIVSAIFLVSVVPLSAQDPCTAKKEYDDAVKEATSAGHKIPKPSKPTGDGGSSLNKSTLEQDLKTATEAKDKAEKAKNQDESALTQANEAVTKFNNDPQKGKKLTSLKTEITTLENNIKKATEASSKFSTQDRMDLNNFKLFEVKPLQDAIGRQMPGLSVEEAKEKVNDQSYDGFSNSEIITIRKEIERNNTVIKNMNDKYVNSSATITAGDDEQIQKAQAAIAAKTAELKTAIDNCRKNVIGNLSSLRKKEEEYTEKLKKLYPDEETRKLVNSLPEMQGELRTKKEEEKTLAEEQKKFQEAAKQAKEKFEGGTKDGKSFTGSRKAYEDSEKKVKTIETNLKKFEEYDKKEKEWNDAEKKKNDADKEAKGKETAFNTAMNEKNAALTNAQTAAALSTLNTRLATDNTALLREAATEVLTNDAKVGENKEKIKAALKAAKTEEQKKTLRQRWKTYITTKVRTHYIRKRNVAEANRLRAIKDNAELQKFKCFSDVETFISLLEQTANEVLERTASLVSDMDSGIPEGADKPIPNELIPPLDEGEEKETPTDEVPDDIAKNTGEVKVDRYYVFLLTNSSNGLYVGSEESLKGRTRCSFVGGGINCKPSDVVTFKKLAGPFASQAEAQAALCQNITESRYFPIGIGLKGRWQGSNNWYGLWDASISGCPPR